LQPRLRHIDALDGLRGVAIALVLALHSGYGPHFLGGGLGVDVFFVLSGYLITSLLLNEYERTGRVSLRSFYLRRVFRLYPALLMMVLAAGVLYADLPGHTIFAWAKAAVVILLYVANFATAFSHNGSLVDGLGHTWTLALEEQFYIVWPLVLIGSLRSGKRWIPYTLLALAAAVSIVSNHHDGPPIGGIPQAYFRPEAHDIGLVFGCAAALLLRHDWWRRVATRRAVGWSGAAVLVAAVVSAGHSHVAYLTESVPIGSLAVAVMIAGIVSNRAHPLNRLLAWSPLRWLGLISYGVYVYSGLFNTVTATGMESWSPAAQCVVRTSVALAVATVSYLALEKPIRQRGRAWLAHRREVAAAEAS